MNISCIEYVLDFNVVSVNWGGEGKERGGKERGGEGRVG